MADFSKITDWAVKNTSRYEISISKLSWIEDWLPGFFDYRVKLRVGNIIYAGRGIDADEGISCDKALAEALERTAVSDMTVPWATAAYPDFSGAAERAYRELVCIDRVLCHHFCKMPFKAVALEILDGTVSPSNLRKVLHRHGLHLELCELRPVMDASAAAAFIWSERQHKVKGIVSGYGCEKSSADAVLHAVIECLRTAVAVFFGDLTPEPWETRCVPGNPRWHFWMAQKEEAKNFLMDNLLPSCNTPSISWETEKISVSDILLKEVTSLTHLIPDVPVRIAQAMSSVMLIPQFGRISMDAQFLQRLHRFAGVTVSPEKLIPHFYD